MNEKSSTVSNVYVRNMDSGFGNPLPSYKFYLTKQSPKLLSRNIMVDVTLTSKMKIFRFSLLGKEKTVIIT
jgi:hypothetical protein